MQTARNEKGIARLDCEAHTPADIQLLVSLVRSGGCGATQAATQRQFHPFKLPMVPLQDMNTAEYQRVTARRKPSDDDGPGCGE